MKLQDPQKILNEDRTKKSNFIQIERSKIFTFWHKKSQSSNRVFFLILLIFTVYSERILKPDLNT